jgi:hypothetical protein
MIKALMAESSIQIKGAKGSMHKVFFDSVFTDEQAVIIPASVANFLTVPIIKRLHLLASG